jgi:hypothetical protein
MISNLLDLYNQAKECFLFKKKPPVGGFLSGETMIKRSK